jgi:hypothetical protein
MFCQFLSRMFMFFSSMISMRCKVTYLSLILTILLPRISSLCFVVVMRLQVVVIRTSFFIVSLLITPIPQRFCVALLSQNYQMIILLPNSVMILKSKSILSSLSTAPQHYLSVLPNASHPPLCSALALHCHPRPPVFSSQYLPYRPPAPPRPPGHHPAHPGHPLTPG